MSLEVRDERGAEHLTICMFPLQCKMIRLQTAAKSTLHRTEIIKSGDLKQGESKEENN